METKANTVDLFGRLLNKDNKAFDSALVKEMYQAREFVLSNLTDKGERWEFWGKDDTKNKDGNTEEIDRFSIGPDMSDKHLHFFIEGSGSLALMIARQIALVAHYPNFDERTGKNRTIITIACTESSAKNVVDTLKGEEYLCNLLNLAKYTMPGHEKNPENKDSYIDIEFKFVDPATFSDIIKGELESEKKIIISAEKIAEVSKISPKQEIDIARANLADAVYNIGSDVDNLPIHDPHTAAHYSLALELLENEKLTEDTINKKCTCSGYESVRMMLSNVFVSDCFESRINGIRKNQKSFDKVEAQIAELSKKDKFQKLCACEHSRWVVEKLILGYRPLGPEERYEDETRLGEEKASYRKKLKRYPQKINDLAHIDLCSYETLRHVNAENMRYDAFMILSMPLILKKLSER